MPTDARVPVGTVVHWVYNGHECYAAMVTVGGADLVNLVIFPPPFGYQTPIDSSWPHERSGTYGWHHLDECPR